MDKIIIKNICKEAVIEQCGTCIHGKDKDLQNMDVPENWVFCVIWSGLKPYQAWCGEFTK